MSEAKSHFDIGQLEPGYAGNLMDNKAHKLPFAGTETMGAVMTPGSTTQENGRLIIRGMVQQAQDAVTDPRVSGDLTIEVNAYFDASTFSGPMWGTFILENNRGKWLCAWIGQRTAQGDSTIDAWGYGVGEFEGLMAHWNYARQNLDPNSPFAIQGYISKKMEWNTGY